MTLQDIIKTDAYIVCKDVKERDAVVEMLRELDIYVSALRRNWELVISVIPSQKLAICMGKSINMEANSCYASQFLPQGEPPLTC